MPANLKPPLKLEFGFYPYKLDIIQGPVTISTLADLAQKRKGIEEHPNVQNGWIYPGNAKTHRLEGGVSTEPYSGRVFGLPKTHAIEHSSANDEKHLKFHVWALSFFTGMRLTTEEAGFLDATPIKQFKLVDFVMAFQETPLAIELAERFWSWNHKKGKQVQIDRFCAAVHALFVSQNPQHLQFEQFIYLYTALDACFRILWETKPETGKEPSHARRLKWMCDRFDIPVPAWADMGANRSTEVAALRNGAIHEGLFIGQPLGFAMEGGESNRNLTLEMEGLVCRLLAGILEVPDKDYFKSSLNDRQMSGLELNPQ